MPRYEGDLRCHFLELAISGNEHCPGAQLGDQLWRFRAQVRLVSLRAARLRLGSPVPQGIHGRLMGDVDIMWFLRCACVCIYMYIYIYVYIYICIYIYTHNVSFHRHKQLVCICVYGVHLHSNYCDKLCWCILQHGSMAISDWLTRTNTS